MGKRIKPVVFILAVCLASLFIVSYLNLRILTEKFYAQKRAQQNVQEEILASVKKLDMINTYEQKYFEIITKHDVLLISESNEEIESDEKQLADLFNEVKLKINPQNPYLVQYNELDKKYAENTGETTFEMNQFAKEKFDAYSALLSDVYNSAKSTLSDEESAMLEESEQNWAKKVEEYNNYFETKDYGTISYIVKSGYETNMYSYRALLLMLYMN